MTIKELRKEIKERGDGTHFDSDFAKALHDLYGVSEMQASNIIRQEAEQRIADGLQKQWGKAVQQSCLYILDMIEHAAEHRIDTDNLDELATFVAGHRVACTWAILVGKKSTEPARRHTLLHRALDELVSCHFVQTKKLFSETTVLELMQWSSGMLQKEQDGEKLPCMGERHGRIKQ